MLAVQADGSELTTVEGLSTDGTLHPMQQAFLEAHGLQCGFCTPGFLISVCELLERTPNPSEEEISDTLGGHICRCTGYQAIVEAVHLAAKKVAAASGEEGLVVKIPNTIGELPMTSARFIGKSVQRVEDPSLLTGKAAFIDNLDLPRHAPLRDPAQPARARAHRLASTRSAAEALPGVFAVVTGEDAKRWCNPTPTVPEGWGTYCLATDKARFVGEPVAAVAAVIALRRRGRARAHRRRVRSAARGRRRTRGALAR